MKISPETTNALVKLFEHVSKVNGVGHIMRTADSVEMYLNPTIWQRVKRIFV